MLAKVKEINYALNGQPDLEKILSLLHETIEYKIWRWGDYKHFTFNKGDFLADFKTNLEENMSIRYIVPYELIADTQLQYFTGTYVYHLEDKVTFEKFMWLSNCIYTFDRDLNVTNISQQGELYPEGEIEISFEALSKEDIKEKVERFFRTVSLEYYVFFNNTVLYDCIMQRFSFPELLSTGFFQGLKQIDKLLTDFKIRPHKAMNFLKPIDIYCDHNSSGYDVAIILVCAQEMSDSDECKEGCTVIGFTRMAFENGKLVKVLDFINAIRDPILSPFDDKSFHCSHIK